MRARRAEVVDVGGGRAQHLELVGGRAHVSVAHRCAARQSVPSAAERIAEALGEEIFVFGGNVVGTVDLRQWVACA